MEHSAILLTCIKRCYRSLKPIFERGPFYIVLSYDVASGSGITPCNKIDKPLVDYRFTGNIMTSITTFVHDDKMITFSKYLSYDK